MIRVLLIVVLFLLGGWWLFTTLLHYPGDSAVITWQGEVYKLKTATLVLAVLLLGITFYVTTWLLFQLLGLKGRWQRMRQARLSGKASRSLTMGLIQLAEGYWDKAEKLLTEHVQYSETPLLNYLTAARAAHMQSQPERRDEWLRRAIASDSKAQIAVGVSQAEMQMSDRQLEQARATLLSLRQLAPKNTYVLKLYAKTLYLQESWDELLSLLPDLLKHKLLDQGSDSMKRIQAASLQGAFDNYARQGDLMKLQALWKKIPQPIRAQKNPRRLYAHALQKAGAEAECARFIVRSNARCWDEELTDLYGRLTHEDEAAASHQAEQWLKEQPNNPVNLLLLGRLYQKQKLWGMARSHYIMSLKQAPDNEAYLELAELLEGVGEEANAQRCYRTGLRYCIRRQSERLDLKPPARN